MLLFWLVVFLFLTTITPVSSAEHVVPVYRMINEETGAVYFTLNPMDKPGGWRRDGIAFFASPEDSCMGKVPVYELYNRDTDSYLFTTSSSERMYAESLGWEYRGVAFCAYSHQGDGLVPVYRLYNPQKRIHFFTACRAEQRFLSSNEGFVSEGIGFFVHPSLGSLKFVGVHLHPFQKSWEGPGPFNDYEMSIREFNQIVGKLHIVVMFFSSWENGEGMYPFGKGYPGYGDVYGAGWIAQQIINTGAIPMITWEPWKAGAGIRQDRYTLDNIINGAFDDYIREFARDVRDWGYPILIRFAHEMNGDYYPWACALNGNDPHKYVEAFRHVRRIFWEEGAYNALFVWSPNYASPPSVTAPCNDLDALYPGDEYVDFIGVSVYNWGNDTTKGPGWRDLDYLAKDFLSLMAEKHPDKWVIVAETGCAHDRSAPEVASWIEKAYGWLSTRGNVAAVVYFNDFAYHNPYSTDFRITTTPLWEDRPVDSLITNAYRLAIQPYYP